MTLGHSIRLKFGPLIVSMYMIRDILITLSYPILAVLRRRAMPNDVRDDLLEFFEAIYKAQLNTLRRLRRNVKPEVRPSDSKSARSMSQVDMVYDILNSAGHPLHISEILARVAKRHGVLLDRESIVSALTKHVARKDRFLRTGPNTFSALNAER